MIHVKSAVNIQASPEDVFSLISDVRRCGELNPRIEVINISSEPAGQLSEGTVIHYRIVVEGRMTEYSSKVVAFEPGRLMETQTDTDPVVTITIRIHPVEGGVCLEQELATSVARQQSTSVELPGWFAKLMGRLEKETNSAEYGDTLYQRQEQTMQDQLQVQLDEWLAIVKKHLEEERNQFFA
ncbi:SRPBCC family protein [Kaarinaea lacus]